MRADAPQPTAARAYRRAAAAQTRHGRRLHTRRRLRRRRLAVTVVVVVAMLAAGGYVLDWWTGASSEEVVVPLPEPPAEPVPGPRPARVPVEPAVTESAVTEAPPVLSLPGDFPTSGAGTFTVAPDEGEVLGEAGPLRRFRVAVEDGSDQDVSEFAELVDETLGHEQSWTAGGDLRFQRVPDGAGHDFTVYLATSQTTGQMCAAAGLYVLAPSFPEGGVSCSPGGQVILNLSRWRLSVPHFLDAEVPLETYRQMLLNHEVGHELGYGHYGCPGDGEPAPVMQQQTLRLDGCEANPWPYLDGAHHTGPPVA